MEMKLNFPNKFFLLITYTWLIQHMKFMECIWNGVVDYICCLNDF